MYSGAYKLRLLTETIARDDGTWHTVDMMPLKGAGIDWERVRFDMFKDWPVLQLWIWDKGEGEAQVQAQPQPQPQVRGQLRLRLVQVAVAAPARVVRLQLPWQEHREEASLVRLRWRPAPPAPA